MALRGGKGSRARRKKFRSQEKRARKASAKKQYETWRDQGVNTKSKRVKLRKVRATTVANVKHAVAFCGNIGCVRCFPHTEYNQKRVLIRMMREAGTATKAPTRAERRAAAEALIVAAAA